MTDHITSLKGALEKYEAWLAAGLPLDGGPYDTYPDDLYQAATRPEAIRSLLAALDEAQKDARRWKTISQEFRVMSPNIDGQHCWIFRSSDRLRGPTMEAAVDAIAAQERDKDA